MVMQKSSYPIYRSLLRIYDWLLLMVVFFLVSEFFPSIQVFKQQEYIHYFYVLNLSWLTSGFIISLYTNGKWFDFLSFTKRSGKALLLTTFLVLFFLFVYKFPYSRLYIFMTLFVFALSIMVSRVVFYFILLAAKSSIEKKIVIIGDNDAASKLVQHFRGTASLVRVEACFIDERISGSAPLPAMVDLNFGNHFSEHILGEKIASRYAAISDVENNGAKRSTKHERLLSRDLYIRSLVRGDINECLSFSLENEISEIYCTVSPESRPELYELAKQAEKHFIPVKFIPDYSGFIRKAVLVNYVEDLPVLSLRPFPLEDMSNRLLKRVLDITLSLFVIVFIMSWLTPLLALLIKLESRGPVFFTQLRSGKNNQPFKCIKFRSLQQHNVQESKQVTKNDSRVTRLGRFLRKSNIDELPQFFNVLIGNMSVVGPRPHMLKHTLEFDELHHEYMVRHFVKPGVTGLAQVNGFRGEIKNPELLRKRVEHDIQYLENWSLWEDIRIILATIFVSLRGDENAY